jgi:hypothetical protein
MMREADGTKGARDPQPSAMVRAMAESARLLFVALVSLLLGGAAGAYATRVLYGEPESVAINTPQAAECAPCPVCPVCPQPAPLDLIPTSTGTSTTAGAAPVAPSAPGLPAAAIRVANQTVGAAIQPCLTSTMAEGVDGTVLLDLTVTASAGEAVFSEVAFARKVGNVEPVERCLRDRIGSARFAWHGEGRGKLRLPVRIDR